MLTVHVPGGGFRRGAWGTTPSKIGPNLAKLVPFLPILASTPPNWPSWIHPWYQPTIPDSMNQYWGLSLRCRPDMPIDIFNRLFGMYWSFDSVFANTINNKELEEFVLRLAINLTINIKCPINYWVYLIPCHFDTVYCHNSMCPCSSHKIIKELERIVIHTFKALKGRSQISKNLDFVIQMMHHHPRNLGFKL